MGTVTHTHTMKLLLLPTLLSLACARPRYLVIDLEAPDQSPQMSLPQLARQARMAQEDSYQSDQGFQQFDRMDTEGAASNAYAAPASPGPDHVDHGAYTGGYGAFGWYTDHPVLLTGHQALLLFLSKCAKTCSLSGTLPLKIRS